MFAGCSGTRERKAVSADEMPSVYLEKDLGAVSPGTTHAVEFAIDNTSGFDWRVGGVTTTCRCMVSDAAPKVILKSAISKFPISLKIGAGTGNIDQVLRVGFENRSGLVVMQVKTKVRTPLYLPHNEIRINATGGEKQPIWVRVENWSNELWSGIELAPSKPWLLVTSLPLDLQAENTALPLNSELQLRQIWVLSITADPPSDQVGDLHESISIQSVKPQHNGTLKVEIHRSHPISAQPQALIVSGKAGSQIPANPLTLSAQLRPATSSVITSFRVRSTSTDLPMGCEVRVMGEGSEQQLNVTIPLNVAKAGVDGRVEIQFEEGLPDLILPVLGRL